MMLKSLFATFGASILALAAASASSQDVQSNTAAKDGKKAEKKVCRWSGTTGSFRRERICFTAEEWRRVDEALAKEDY